MRTKIILGKFHPLPSILPGFGLTALVGLVALAAEKAQLAAFGSRWLDGLVIAIMLGAALRSLLPLSSAFQPGVAFSAKTLLEIAVVLIGASISTTALAETGVPVIVAIALIVVASLFSSYGIGRAVGLPHRLALLVACGNSICGNSAIAATAPVIGAPPRDVAAAIAFTAVLGVAAVLLMPMLQGALSLNAVEYGTFAGLTVYAVPQVLAATAPAGALSVQTGTLVKLLRVMMLGPVVFTLGIAHGVGSGQKIALRHIVPWFIIGFALMLALRAAGLLPATLLAPIGEAANLLTLLSMAALGLSVDIRDTAKAGGRVMGAALLSLAALSLFSLIALHLLALR